MTGTTYGKVRPPVNLLPQERQRAIANLRAQGVSIDDAATLGEISRAIARLTLEGGARTKHERVARVRNFSASISRSSNEKPRHSCR